MSKLKRLLESTPPNGVILDSWLKKLDISNSLKQRYLKSGWLKSLGRGASYRSGDTPTWQGAIIALNKDGMQLHIGGKTALSLRGLGHFISKDLTHLQIYGRPGVHLPQWFIKQDWGTKVIYIQSTYLPAEVGIESDIVLSDSTMVKLSSYERAYLELISLIPKKQSIDEAFYIAENLPTPDLKLLESLLENCTSVKVKRLFLYLTEKAGHSWINSLDLSKITLGSGNRQIVPGGYLEPKYHITIPKNWKGDEPSIF